MGVMRVILNQNKGMEQPTNEDYKRVGRNEGGKDEGENSSAKEDKE